MHCHGFAGSMPRPPVPEDLSGGVPCESKKNTSKPTAFEVSRKRLRLNCCDVYDLRGLSSASLGAPHIALPHVKRGDPVVGGTKELLEKLGGTGVRTQNLVAIVDRDKKRSVGIGR